MVIPWRGGGGRWNYGVVDCIPGGPTSATSLVVVASLSMGP
jgi:hypothetical protein